MKHFASMLAATLLLLTALVVGQPEMMAAAPPATERGGAAAAMPAGGEAGARGGPTKYSATLSGTSSVPPVETKASGTFDMTCSESANHVNDECSWEMTVRGIQDMTMAHIHQGGPAENGPVVVWLVPEEKTAPAASSLPMLSPPFSGSQTFKGSFGSAGLGGPATGKTIDDIRSMFASGQFQGYVNVHTSAHPDGEIRGQLRSA